ncbi:MAG: CbiX/SirB N-terminal domain-containing protein [Cocleimonas sp.]
MKHLLIIAHGSRRMASNDEVREVTRKFSQQIHDFDKVSTAFLELDDPSIPQGLLNAIEEGATEVIVLPYFLSAGRHVSEDIPAQVASVKEKHPKITIKIAPYLGASGSMPEILLAQTKGI